MLGSFPAPLGRRREMGSGTNAMSTVELPCLFGPHDTSLPTLLAAFREIGIPYKVRVRSYVVHAEWPDSKFTVWVPEDRVRDVAVVVAELFYAPLPLPSPEAHPCDSCGTTLHGEFECPNCGLVFWRHPAEGREEDRLYRFVLEHGGASSDPVPGVQPLPAAKDLTPQTPESVTRLGRLLFLLLVAAAFATALINIRW